MLQRLAILVGMAGAEGVRLLQMVGRRRALVSALVGTALVVVAAGVVRFLDDYLTLRRQRESLTALAPRLAEQQALIDLYQKRVRELRAEIDGWRDLHARIWEPFGPDAGPHTHSGESGAEAPRARSTHR